MCHYPNTGKSRERADQRDLIGFFHVILEIAKTSLRYAPSLVDSSFSDVRSSKVRC